MRPKYSIVISNGWDKHLILEILPFDIPTGAQATRVHGRTVWLQRCVIIDFVSEENQRGRQVWGAQIGRACRPENRETEKTVKHK